MLHFFYIMHTNLQSRHSIIDTQYIGYLRERANEDNGSHNSLLAEIIDRSVTRMHTILRYIIKKDGFQKEAKQSVSYFGQF